MVLIRGIEVGILDKDREPLKEYNVKEDDFSTTSCYVASEEGQRFYISLSAQAAELDQKAVDFDVCFDGRSVGGLVIDVGRIDIFGGVFFSKDHLKELRFGRLHVTEDDGNSTPMNPQAWDKLGLVEVKVRRISATCASDANHNPQDFSAAVKDDSVNELGKKAGMHHISLGDEFQDPQEVKWVMPEYIESLECPYAAFRIYYRPEAILKAQGIIPHSDAPPPVSQDVTMSQAASSSQVSASRDTLTRQKRPTSDLQHAAVGPGKRSRVGSQDAMPVTGDNTVCSAGHSDPVQIKREQAESDDDSDDDNVKFMKNQIDVLQKQIEKLQKRVEKAQSIKLKSRSKVKQEVKQESGMESSSLMGAVVIDLTD